MINLSFKTGTALSHWDSAESQYFCVFDFHFLLLMISENNS